MKRIYVFFLFASTMFFISFADDGSTAAINLQHQGHDDHGQYYPPADMPEAYFDSDEMEIIIEAEGYADYYIVEVVSMVSSLTVIYTQIDGYGDTIDVSSLPEGYYQLVITSEFNNVYEGFFLIVGNK